jgi:hypothetical protein
MTEVNAMEQVQRFLDEWTTDALETKPAFQFLYEGLQGRAGVNLEWIPRPGISYSLRASHENQKDRPLFVMLDIIDDDAEERWLSVCFYGDMVSDPEELGDLIPGGLLGSDGYCFDVSDGEEALKQYVGARIQESWENARGN